MSFISGGSFWQSIWIDFEEAFHQNVQEMEEAAWEDSDEILIRVSLKKVLEKEEEAVAREDSDEFLILFNEKVGEQDGGGGRWKGLLMKL